MSQSPIIAQAQKRFTVQMSIPFKLPSTGQRWVSCCSFPTAGLAAITVNKLRGLAPNSVMFRYLQQAGI